MSSGSASGANGTDLHRAALTTTTAPNETVVSVFGLNTAGTVTPPTTVTELFDTRQDTGAGTAIAEASEMVQVKTGVTTGLATTASVSTAWVGQQIALKRAAGGTGAIGPGSDTNTSVAAAGSIVVTTPTNVQPNDLILAHIGVNGGTGTTVTAPAGWTLIRRTNNGANNGSGLYYHVAVGGEAATYTWTLAPATDASGAMIVYRGVDISNPIDVSSGGTGTSTAAAAPTVTTTATNDRVVGFYTLDLSSSFTRWLG